MTEEYERLATEDLAGLRLGLLHGQMPVARQGGRDGAVPRRRPRRAGRDDRHRGRRRRPERDGDDRRGRRSLRPLAAPSAPRDGSVAAASTSHCFLFADPSDPRRRGAPGGDRGVHRRFRAGREGPRDPWLGGGVRRPSVGVQRPEAGADPPRRGRGRRGATRGGGDSRPTTRTSPASPPCARRSRTCSATTSSSSSRRSAATARAVMGPRPVRRSGRGEEGFAGDRGGGAGAAPAGPRRRSSPPHRRQGQGGDLLRARVERSRLGCVGPRPLGGERFAGDRGALPRRASVRSSSTATRRQSRRSG